MKKMTQEEFDAASEKVWAQERQKRQTRMAEMLIKSFETRMTERGAEEKRKAIEERAWLYLYV